MKEAELRARGTRKATGAHGRRRRRCRLPFERSDFHCRPATRTGVSRLARNATQCLPKAATTDARVNRRRGTPRVAAIRALAR